MKARKIAAVFCLWGIAGLAAAQEQPGQTPENAQAFLAKVVAAGGVGVAGKRQGFPYGVSDFFPSAGTQSYPDGQLSHAAPIADASGRNCLTKLSGTGKYGSLRPNSVGGRSFGMNPLWDVLTPSESIDTSDERYGHAVTKGEGVLYWSQVSRVDVEGNRVLLSLTYAGGGLAIALPSADLAKRVGFALEVIRLGCDATADANF